jgi:hypothetical protein
MERGLIYRTNEDYSYAVIPFNLREVMKGKADDLQAEKGGSGAGSFHLRPE